MNLGCEHNADAASGQVVQGGSGSPSGEGDGSVQGAKEWGGGRCRGLGPGWAYDRPHTGASLQEVRDFERRLQHNR